MTVTFVDSNVLLDLATADPHWGSWSADKLGYWADRGVLVINTIVYAEVSINYERIEEVQDFLTGEAIAVEELPVEAAFAAGKCFLRYRRRGGTKTAPLPDFFIGAHAAARGYQLLTRDARRYRSYFPALELICPQEA